MKVTAIGKLLDAYQDKTRVWSARQLLLLNI